MVKGVRFLRRSDARYSGGISVPLLAACVALYFMAVLNGGFWREATRIIPLDSVGAGVFHLALFVGLTSLYALCLTLCTVRFVGKGLVIFLVVLAGSVAYFMDTFGVRIDRTMLTNVLQTDVTEASDFFTFSMFWQVGLMGILPACLVAWVPLCRRSFGREVLRRLLFGLLCAVLAVGAVAVQYKEMVSFFRANRQMRTLLNPFNAVDAGVTLAMREWLDRAVVIKPLGQDAKLAPHPGKPRLVVLVLGEAARAQSFSLNGYERPTNPVLGELDVLNFSDVSACGTSTAVSVPCMFSAFTRQNYTSSKGREYENLMDVLKHAGIRVLWRDNNSGSKGVASRVGEEAIYDQRVEGLCNSGGCYDEILLRDLDTRLAEAQPGEDILLVLHQKGSHGPSYYQRYPEAFQKFLPECRTTELQKCTEQEVRNTYDNTILYTDYFLGQVVENLKSRADTYDTAMLYVSDHGESTGEYGAYLHGMPYMVAPREQTQIPMIMWFSETFPQSARLRTDCLARNATRPYSHDNLFHSVLGLMDVQTSVYERELDMFAQCR